MSREFGTAYDITLMLHILVAIVGFGTVFLNGIYGARIKQLGEAGRLPEALSVANVNHRTSMVAEYLIYLVPLLGIGLVFMSAPEGSDARFWTFGDTWIWLSLVLYGVGISLSHGLLLPNEKKMRGLMEEMVGAGPPPAGATGPPPQAVELARRGKVVAATGTSMNVILIVILYLMIFKPGT